MEVQELESGIRILGIGKWDSQMGDRNSEVDMRHGGFDLSLRFAKEFSGRGNVVHSG